MKRLAIVLVGVGVLAGGFYAAFAAGYLPPEVTALFAMGQGEVAAAPASVTSADAAAAAPQQESVESAPAAQAIAGARVIADAKVVPIQRADLSMRLPGIVREVLVQEGELVAAGQVLVKLDDALQQVAVAQATANLQRAQANLAQIKAGAREQEVTAAEAALAAAQANYEQLANGAAPGQIEAAQAAVAQAQAGLSQVLEGPSEAALIAVRADVAAAEAQLKQATSAYNQVKERSDIGMLPQSLALQQATIAYEAAQARMNDVMNGATPAQVASANAGVRQAVAQLNTLRNSTPSQIEAAAAAVAQAQAQVDLVKAGARTETIAIGEADVAAATAALQQALVNLADTELRAPFDGTVALVNVASGEQVNAGLPVVSLADTTAWEVETADLTEFDVVGVKQGQQVTLTFDAIPDLELAGAVNRIRPIGEDNRGDTVYKVVVKPTRNDDRLLWNMTAVVEFAVQ